MFAQGMIVSLFGSKENKENINALLRSIIMINSDYIRRISHPEPGMRAKVFYNHLKTSFNKTTLELSEQLSNFN